VNKNGNQVNVHVLLPVYETTVTDKYSWQLCQTTDSRRQ